MKYRTSLLVVSILVSGCASTGKLPTATGNQTRINSAEETQALMEQSGFVLVGPKAESPAVKEYFMRDPIRLSRIPSPENFKRIGAALLNKTVTISFPYSSTEFKPTGAQRFHMRQLSAIANRVEINGRTSNEVSTPEAIQVATERANAAKRYLLGHKMPGTSISINVMGSGDFVADNHTRAGRALNQRVEIEFFFEGDAS